MRGRYEDATKILRGCKDIARTLRGSCEDAARKLRGRWEDAARTMQEDTFLVLEQLWMSIHGVKRGHHDQMMRHARGDPLIDKMSTGPVMVRCMLV